MLKIDCDDFVGLQGRQNDVDSPEQNEKEGSNVLALGWTAELSIAARRTFPAKHENSNCEKGKCGEHQDAESQTSTGNHELVTLNNVIVLQIDGVKESR